MEPWMAIPAMLLVKLGLWRLEKGDTTVGRKLRSSTHEAWAIAVERKQRELAELMAAEPDRN